MSAPNTVKPIYVQKIAKIDSTHLGWEDHGIFTAWAHVDYGGSVQGIGGYGLSAYDKNLKVQVGTEYGMEWIIRFLRACGVDRWEKLSGRTIYVLFDKDQWGAMPLGVAPLPTEPGEPFVFADIADLAKTVRS